MIVITYPCWDWSWSLLVEGKPLGKHYMMKYNLLCEFMGIWRHWFWMKSCGKQTHKSFRSCLVMIDLWNEDLDYMIYQAVLAWHLRDNLVLKCPVTMSLFDTYCPGKRFMFFWKIEATLNVFPYVISIKWNTEPYYQWISLMIIINGWPYFHSHNLNSPRLMFLSVDVLLWILTKFTYQLTLITKQSCHSHYVFLMHILVA